MTRQSTPRRPLTPNTINSPEHPGLKPRPTSRQLKVSRGIAPGATQKSRELQNAMTRQRTPRCPLTPNTIKSPGNPGLNAPQTDRPLNRLPSLRVFFFPREGPPLSHIV
jgi:hypothetical protein